MRKITLALIGAGNVMKTRHMPALMKNKHLFSITGVMDTDGMAVKDFAKKFKLANHSAIRDEKDLQAKDWFLKCEAVIIGIPPQYHYLYVKECLLLGKHVIVEKPFTVHLEEAKELVELAKKKNLVLAVKHNFQYTRSFLKLEQMIAGNELGEIKSVHCVQLTNQSRRIPSWTEELPLGLFYDESPHYFYLVPKFTKGEIQIKSAFQHISDIRKSTPQIINLNLQANQIPVTVYWNFDSPVCEWYFTILGDKKLVTVDLFRDIIITLPNDSPHLGMQVMRTSVLITIQHWMGVFKNGFLYIQNKLYYGFDIVQHNFYKAITENDLRYVRGMSGEDGLQVTEIQHKIVHEILKNDHTGN